MWIIKKTLLRSVYCATAEVHSLFSYSGSGRFSRWSFLLVNRQRAAESAGPDSARLRVRTKRLIPVLGQGENSCDIFTPAGRSHFKSSTKCLTATRMYAPWLTTRTWADAPWRPSLAEPWEETSEEAPSLVDCATEEVSCPEELCSSSICSKRTCRKFLNLSLTWNQVTGKLKVEHDLGGGGGETEQGP